MKWSDLNLNDKYKWYSAYKEAYPNMNYMDIQKDYEDFYKQNVRSFADGGISSNNTLPNDAIKTNIQLPLIPERSPILYGNTESDDVNELYPLSIPQNFGYDNNGDYDMNNRISNFIDSTKNNNPLHLSDEEIAQNIVKNTYYPFKDMGNITESQLKNSGVRNPYIIRNMPNGGMSYNELVDKTATESLIEYYKKENNATESLFYNNWNADMPKDTTKIIRLFGDPNAKINKAIHQKYITKGAIREAQRVGTKYNISPYEIIARMLGETYKGDLKSNPVTNDSESYFNTHDVFNKLLEKRYNKIADIIDTYNDSESRSDRKQYLKNIKQNIKLRHQIINTKHLDNINDMTNIERIGYFINEYGRNAWNPGQRKKFGHSNQEFTEDGIRQLKQYNSKLFE